MDDPLVGLAVWQSQRAEENKRTSQKSGRILADQGRPSSQTIKSDSNRLLEVVDEESRASSSSDNCFPCLPSLDMPKTSRIPPTTERNNEKCKADNDDEKTDKNELENSINQSPQLENYWLLRLFESNLFTMEIALQYLYNETDTEVQIYLGKRLSSFDNQIVDFYLPELTNMYIHLESLSPIIQKYFLSRCQHDVTFSLKLAWLLLTFASDKWLPLVESQRASRLLSLIQMDQIRPHPLPQASSVECIDNLAIPNGNSEKLHHHHRSLSATINTSVSLSDLPHCHMNGNKTSIGDVRSGQAFDSGCTCVVTTSTSHCQCSASRLIAQDLFVQTLGQISNRLLKYSQRSLRTNQLYAEVSQLNLNLPARISIPLYLSNHHILRIPPSEAAVLNSKSKAPYLLLVEVAIVKDTFLSPLTKRYLDKSTMANVKLCPEDVKNFIHSEGSSPLNTRVSSMPNVRCSACLDTISLNSLENMSPSIAEEDEEIEKEDNASQNSSEKDDGSPVTFAVSEIRERLSKELLVPRRSFSRDPDDPSASVMKELWEDKVKRIRESSPYGHLPNWHLLSVIIKWGDDLRQELITWQLLEQFKNIWSQENVPLWIKPYTVLVLSPEGGLIEPVKNAVSLHQIKRECKGSLLDYFKHEYGGDMNSEKFQTARRNFIESCAAYCLVCYFIQIKDRHNGNILLDSDGHLIHIDFGFILAHSPGKNMRFENSPFKLTPEFIEVMGGVDNDMYKYFKFLMLRGFLASRKHMERIINIVDIMQKGSQLSCFGHGPSTVKQLRERFHLSLTEEQLELLLNGMIDTSLYSLTTRLYDGFQYLTNGIL